MTTLSINHDFKGHLWCGVGALSAARHAPTSICKRLFRHISTRRFIKGITYSEMASAIYATGAACVERSFFPRNGRDCPMLKDYVETGCTDSSRTYVICITGHWIVVRNGTWICSIGQKQRDLDSCPYSRCRVRHVISFDHTKSIDWSY